MEARISWRTFPLEDNKAAIVFRLRARDEISVAIRFYKTTTINPWGAIFALLHLLKAQLEED